jgi:histone-lysine N-methyltransferase SETMAR
MPPPGRAPDERLDDCIGKALKEDPHLSTRKIAKVLSISSTTGQSHLTKSFGMKCYHMQWVPHTFTAAQQAKRREMAGSMLQTLESYAASNFHFLWTGDESWMFYGYHHEITWAASWEEVDELERPMHYHSKTMVTAFFNGTWHYFLNIFPRSRCMDTSYFAGEIIGGLEHICYPEGRNRHERKRILHFDSAGVHNTRTVMEQLEQSGFKRMEHPPYSPDLAPCDFFLFGYTKELLKRRTFVEEEELLSVLSELMRLKLAL